MIGGWMIDDGDGNVALDDGDGNCGGNGDGNGDHDDAADHDAICNFYLILLNQLFNLSI